MTSSHCQRDPRHPQNVKVTNDGESNDDTGGPTAEALGGHMAVWEDGTKLQVPSSSSLEEGIGQGWSPRTP